MTNPKHTSSDLVEWCSQDLPCARYQALEAENERLTDCLAKANAQAEHFEREWYLRADRIEALEAENERLREALEWYVAEDAKYMRAALGEKQ